MVKKHGPRIKTQIPVLDSCRNIPTTLIEPTRPTLNECNRPIAIVNAGQNR
jgi:hypothetical protein